MRQGLPMIIFSLALLGSLNPTLRRQNQQLGDLPR